MEVVVYGSFVVSSVLALALHSFARTGNQHKQTVSNPTFLKFQRCFFLAYFLALLGDWLQGPYVYSLYSYYGYEEFNIAVLYVAGFASSVLVGTFTGSLADALGRKRIAMLYCLIYILCCLAKLSSNYWMLLVGRIMGGIATSMLFSVFESWYVCEHMERHGFPSDWIQITFSTATLCNGLIAIVAGVVADVAAEAMGFGPLAPFIIAIPPLALCFVIISQTWTENYGDEKQKLSVSCCEGLKDIVNNREILMLGIIQTLVESCMYIFVFLWTPVMSVASPPYGMVFACFMVALMIGSSLYTIVLSRGLTSKHALKLSLILISASLAVCSVFSGPDRTMFDVTLTFFAFVVFEVAIGIYFPSMSYLKSQVIPEAHRASVMNWFRVPMNVITCFVLLSLRISSVAVNKNLIFTACFSMAFLGVVIVNRFLDIPSKHQAHEQEKKVQLAST